MAYKRYFYKNGKKFGPYYYQSYRDNSGKVRKKYVGTKDPDEKTGETFADLKNIPKTSDFRHRFLILGILVFILVVMDLMILFTLI